MYKIAKPAPDTPLSTIQPTTRLPEIRHRAQLAVDRSRRIPPTVQIIARLLRAVLILEPRIHVADQVVVVIVADHELLELAVLAHLAPDVLVKGVEVVLELRGVHAVLGVEGGVVVQVGHQDRLRVRRLDVLARAPVAVAAGANFVVEGAVDFVLLGAEDGGEEVGHFEGGGGLFWRLG